MCSSPAGLSPHWIPKTRSAPSLTVTQCCHWHCPGCVSLSFLFENSTFTNLPTVKIYSNRQSILVEIFWPFTDTSRLIKSFESSAHLSMFLPIMNPVHLSFYCLFFIHKPGVFKGWLNKLFFLRKKKLESSNALVPWSGKTDALPSCLSSQTVNKSPRHSLPRVEFFTFLASCFWWFHCWNCPPSTVMKCCLVLISSRSLWRASQIEYVLQDLSSGLSYDVPGSELNVNHQ